MNFEPIDINIVKMSKKHWIRVLFPGGKSWFPGLIHIAQIISGIGKCEDEKYPNGEGFRYTQRFIGESWGKSREEIRKLYYAKYDPNDIDRQRKGVRTGVCICGELALPNDKWCKICREALDLWDKP